MTSHRNWTDRFPGRLEYELEEFSDRGLEFVLDERLLEEQGLVVLTGAIFDEGEGREIELEVRFPDLYPYLRPEVFATGLDYRRHRNPYEGNLCLLDRSTRAWRTGDTGAWLVEERVPELLRLLRAGGEELKEAEAPQGEPLVTYFPVQPGALVLVPATALSMPVEARHGSGRIALGPGERPQLLVRGLLKEAVKKKGTKNAGTLAKADEALTNRFSGKEIPFRWSRLDSLPDDNTAEALQDAIEAAAPGAGALSWTDAHGGEVAITAAVVTDEVMQGVYEDAWLFVVHVRQDRGAVKQYMVRGDRLSREDLYSRLPARLQLGECTASVAGLGALGGEVVTELAKTGIGSVRGLDCDAVEVGTTVRWIAGLGAAGVQKTDYLKAVLARDYPYTSFESINHRIGGSAHIRSARTESEFDVLDRHLEDSTVLIDATAELGVQYALEAEAQERGIPYICCSATEGAMGGMVALIQPGRPGCWMCLQLRLHSGDIELPGHEETGTVQPRGCGTLTYTGAGFDLLPVSAQAVRVATAVMSGTASDSRSRAFVFSFDEDGLGPPSWDSHVIEPHPECARCAALGQ